MDDIDEPIQKLLIWIPQKWHSKWSNNWAVFAFPLVLLAQIVFTILVGVFAGAILSFGLAYSKRNPEAGLPGDICLIMLAVISTVMSFLGGFVLACLYGIGFLILKRYCLNTYEAINPNQDLVQHQNNRVQAINEQFIQNAPMLEQHVRVPGPAQGYNYNNVMN